MSHRPSENVGPVDVLTPDNAVLLLIDHQVGLMQLVDDMPPEQFKSNLVGLARSAKTLGVPVILTTSRDWGPNGQILPELKALFPGAEIIRRPGVINAYRWPEFRAALEATGRRKVIVAGVTASTCMLFPSLDLLADGYDVHSVIDASGSESPGDIVRQSVIADVARAGGRPRTWFSVVAELEADWRRDETQGWPLAAGAVHDHVPAWGYLLDTNMDYGSERMTAPGWFVPGGQAPTPDRPGYPRSDTAAASA
jgi:nicotinamidase-related amidase